MSRLWIVGTQHLGAGFNRVCADVVLQLLDDLFQVDVVIFVNSDCLSCHVYLCGGWLISRTLDSALSERSLGPLPDRPSVAAGPSVSYRASLAAALETSPSDSRRSAAHVTGL